MVLGEGPFKFFCYSMPLHLDDAMSTIFVSFEQVFDTCLNVQLYKNPFRYSWMLLNTCFKSSFLIGSVVSGQVSGQTDGQSFAWQGWQAGQGAQAGHALQAGQGAHAGAGGQAAAGSHGGQSSVLRFFLGSTGLKLVRKLTFA